MALGDIFKIKKKGKRPKEKVIKKPKPVEEDLKETKKPIVSEAYRILKGPHITEKAAVLSKENQYIFKVYPQSNKSEIRKAVQNLYGVKVVSVRVIKIPRKKRRLGRTEGWKKGYKKAIVKLKEGEKIEIIPR